ncbi:hypothetical protein CIL05_01235 [Virgibacillus profundi]|uniref:Sulfatase N-terminal domain-containing protein n=1 Tax=Virgibacillus profundi TaxID=2024555 RepID=A0A2A2IJ67_9BACI|nr:LTA synthase family protein [Virgibacillus profundi]PAV31304.1 hypothetical protein CIL05_01235 [Virgibacillus profundi]PXY55489.1 LTA synthase family protein [Virgibacillus profundi]
MKINEFFKSYFILFSIIIYLKFIILRYSLFEEVALLHIFSNELIYILILFIVYELLLKKTKLIAYLTTNFILSLLFFGIIVYEKYFQTIPTYFDFEQINQIGSVSDSIFILVSPVDFVYFFDFILLFILFFILSKTKNSLNSKSSKKLWTPLLVVLILIASFKLNFIKDEQILDVGLFAKNNGYINTQIIQAYSETAFAKTNKLIASTSNDEEVSQKDIIRLKGNQPVPFEEHDQFGLAKEKDLIILQIESMQDFAINLEIAGQEITPNINEWVKNSYYFSNVYQQIGAGNTSDAEFLMNSSIYPLGNRAVSNNLPDHEIPSLPRILADESYYAATFHADDIDYWNRIELYPALGFNDYYDIDFFGDQDIIGIGPSDEVLFDKSLEKLIEIDQEYENYYTMINSMTSHTPFEIPEEKQMLDLPAEYDDTLFGNYLQSIHYTDYTIGKFFSGLKEKGLWENSIIALYGDHSGLHGQLLTDKDVELLRGVLGSYSLMQRFNIPFIIDIPGVIDKGREINNLGGQIDMMPTILNLMGVKPEKVYFGQNLLQYEKNLIGMRYYLPAGSFFNGDVLYITESSKRDIRIYDMKNYKKIDDQFENPREYFDEDFRKMLQLYNWSDYVFQEGTSEF